MPFSLLRTFGVTVAAVLAGLLTLAGPAAAQVSSITKAAVERGQLIITGKTILPNQAVKLDGVAWGVTSNAARDFAFSLAYLPSDCIADLTAGTGRYQAVIANCAPSGTTSTFFGSNHSLVDVPSGTSRQICSALVSPRNGNRILFNGTFTIQNMEVDTRRAFAVEIKKNGVKLQTVASGLLEANSYMPSSFNYILDVTPGANFYVSADVVNVLGGRLRAGSCIIQGIVVNR